MLIKLLRKITGIFLLSLLVLLTGCLIIVQSPAFQTWAAKEVAQRISKSIGAKVEIRKVKIRFFDRAVIEGFYVEDLHKDTMLYVDKIEANFDDVYLNATHFDFDHVKLTDGQFNVRQFWNEDDLNIQFILDILDPPRKPGDTTHSIPPELFFWKAELENIDFTYEYRDSIPDSVFGMDYDHLKFTDIHARIDRFLIINDSLSGEIRNMQCREASGFEVKEFKSDFIISYNTMEFANLKAKTPKSEMVGKVRFDYTSYDDLTEFIDSVQIRSKIRSSRVNLEELSVFSEELRGFDLNVDVAGNLIGTVGNLRGRNMTIEFGQKTRMLGNFQFIGLPETDSMYYSLQMSELRTFAPDLTLIKTYPFITGKPLEIPQEIIDLGTLTYRGKLSGTLDNVSAEGELETAAGTATAEVNLRYNNEIEDYYYEGFVATKGFDLSKIIHSKPTLGIVAGDAIIHGESFNPDLMIASIDGTINSFTISGYPYQNIVVNGEVARNVYNGKLKISDPNLRLDFQGLADFTKLNSKFDFNASIDRIDLSALKLIQRDSAFIISTEIVSNFTGNNLDNLYGQIELMNSTMTYGTQRFRMEDLLLEASGSPYDREIKLYSDMADAEISGAFRLAAMQDEISDVLNTFLPSYTRINTTKTPLDFNENFHFSANIKDISLLQELFFPELEFQRGTQVSGRFDSGRSLIQVDVNAPSFTASGVRFDQVKTSATADNNRLSISASSPLMSITDSVSIKHVNIQGDVLTDSMGIKLGWASKASLTASDAELNAKAIFKGDNIRLNLLPSLLLIGDTIWQVNEGNSLTISKGAVDIDNMAFSHGTEFVRVDGKLSKDPNDEVDVVLDNFSLKNLNPFISENDIQLSGTTKGIISFSEISKQLLFKSNLEFKGIQINNDFIGDGSLISKWDPENKRVLLDGFLGTKEFRKLAFNGHFSPDKKENSIDLKCEIRNLRLELFKPYVTDLFSNISGLLDGDLHLTGSLEKPVVNGELSFDKRTFVTVDILNTRYQVLDKVQIRKNLIFSKTLMLRDVNQNIARCDIKITHNYFKDFILDVRIDADKIQALNTNETQSDLFFGTGYVTGNFRAYGPIDNVIMDINAKTEKGTIFNLPLSGTSDVSQKDFIVFESASQKAETKKQKKKKKESRGYELNFNLEVTPEAEARLLFDPKIGDAISGNGSANLRLEVTEAGDFNVYGDYNIDKGEYLFTLQTVINRKFIVQKGGVISFRGDPYDADINLSAAYRVRTSLFELVKNIDSTAAVKRQIDVDALLKLTGKMMQPLVNFDIVLPNADEQTRNLLKSQIVNEDDLNRQVFSLVVFRSFLPSQSIASTASNIGIVGTNVSELLTNQLNNMLSQLSKDINIGVNYAQGDITSNDQVNVNVSTAIFNDRVQIDGSFGNAGTTANTNVSNTTNLVGEFNIEIKVTADGNVRIKVFNRSNQYLLVTNDVPYTQGVGVFYRREFDEVKDLKRKRKNKPLIQ